MENYVGRNKKKRESVLPWFDFQWIHVWVLWPLVPGNWVLWLLSRLVVFDVLQPHGLQHTALPCPSLSPGVCSMMMDMSWWCHPTSVAPLSSYSQSFPASGSFPVSLLFASGGLSIGVSASASFLPVNTQGWFPLRLAGLISLQSKWLSRVFSSTTVWKHQFFATQFLYGPALTSVHDYWKNHSFDCTELCWQSDVSAF